MTNRVRAWLAISAKLSITFGFLAWLLYSVNWDELIQLISGISVTPLILVTILLVALTIPVARRWQLVVSALGGTIRYFASLRMILMTVLVNQCVPSNLGGDAYRIMATSLSGMPWTRATLAAIVDRLIALLALALVVLLGVLARLDHSGLGNQTLIAIIGTCLIVGGTLTAWIFFRSRFAARLAHRSDILQRLITALGELIHKPVQASYLVALSIFIHSVSITVMSIVAIIVGINVPLFPLLAVCALGLLISRLPVSLGGWGVREGTLVLGFAQFGISRELALAASITYGLTELAAAILGGIIWVVWAMASDTKAGVKRQTS